MKGDSLPPQAGVWVSDAQRAARDSLDAMDSNTQHQAVSKSCAVDVQALENGKHTSPSSQQHFEESPNKWKRQGFIETLESSPRPQRSMLRARAKSVHETARGTGHQANSSDPTTSGHSNYPVRVDLVSSFSDDSDSDDVASESSLSSSVEEDLQDYSIVTAKRCYRANEVPQVLHNVQDILNAACINRQKILEDQRGQQSAAKHISRQQSLQQLLGLNISPASSTPDTCHSPRGEQTALRMAADRNKWEHGGSGPAIRSHTEKAQAAVLHRAREREASSFEILQSHLDPSEDGGSNSPTIDRSLSTPSSDCHLTSVQDVFTSSSSDYRGSPLFPAPARRFETQQQPTRIIGSILRQEGSLHSSSRQSSGLGLTFYPSHIGQSTVDINASSAIQKSRNLRSTISSEALCPQPKPAARARRIHRASGNDVTSNVRLSPLSNSTRVLSASQEPSEVVVSPSRSETSLPLSSESVKDGTSSILRSMPSLLGARVKYSVPTSPLGVVGETAKEASIPISSGLSGDFLVSSPAPSLTRDVSESSEISEHPQRTATDDSGEALLHRPYPRSHKPESMRLEADQAVTTPVRHSESFTELRNVFEQQLVEGLCSSDLGIKLAASSALAIDSEQPNLKGRHTMQSRNPQAKGKMPLRPTFQGEVPQRSESLIPFPCTQAPRIRKEATRVLTDGEDDPRRDGRGEQVFSMGDSRNQDWNVPRHKDLPKVGQTLKESRPNTPEMSAESALGISSSPPVSPPKTRWWKRGGKRASQLGRSLQSIKTTSNTSSNKISEEQREPSSPDRLPRTPTRITSTLPENLPPMRSPLGSVSQEFQRPQEREKRSSKLAEGRNSCDPKFVSSARQRDSSMMREGSSSAFSHPRSSLNGHRLPYWPSFGSKKAETQVGFDAIVGTAGTSKGGKSSVGGPQLNSS
ncbi:unnamed protein product [Sympodiomycopsis kandeliae]